MQSKKLPDTLNSPASLTEDLLLCRLGLSFLTSDDIVSCSLFLLRLLELLGVAACESLLPGDTTHSRYCNVRLLLVRIYYFAIKLIDVYFRRHNEFKFIKVRADFNINKTNI